MSDSKLLAQKIRRIIIELTHKNNASHVGGALSVADILAVLYTDILKFDSNNSSWHGRDRLFFSKGHACTALYAILHEVGFFNKTYLESFTKDGSIFTSHVNHKIPGVEFSTGSLGHALPVACGVALAGKRKKADWHVFCILSDGELNEGSNWEAILFAPHHKLNNLTIIIDYNKIQSFGSVKEVLDLEPLSSKFKSFGWKVLEVDGHSHEELLSAFDRIKIDNEIPRVIISHTVKGKGVNFMENQLAWHYKSPNKEQFAEAIHQIGLK